MTSYIIMASGKYLVALVESFTGSGVRRPRFSAHKYDAARVPDLEDARHIVRCLAEDESKWQILKFNPLNGEVIPA